MTTHSSFVWRILWTEEPGGLLSIGSHRVGHDWSDLACMHSMEKEIATHSSVLAWRIPETEEPGGLPSMGSHGVRHDWSDLAAAAAAAFANISNMSIFAWARSVWICGLFQPIHQCLKSEAKKWEDLCMVKAGKEAPQVEGPDLPWEICSNLYHPR